MYSNWAFRSGCDDPSRVLRLACRLYPVRRNNLATVTAPTGWFSRVNSSANRRMLLHVQRNGDSGSPRVVGSIKVSRAANKSGSVSARGRRPPPGRRTRIASDARRLADWSNSPVPT
jgi:hypothetical protein